MVREDGEQVSEGEVSLALQHPQYTQQTDAATAVVLGSDQSKLLNDKLTSLLYDRKYEEAEIFLKDHRGVDFTKSITWNFGVILGDTCRFNIERAISFKNEFGMGIDFTESIKESFRGQISSHPKGQYDNAKTIKEHFGEGIDFTQDIRDNFEKKLSEGKLSERKVDEATSCKYYLGKGIHLSDIIQKYKDTIEEKFTRDLKHDHIPNVIHLKETFDNDIVFDSLLLQNATTIQGCFAGKIYSANGSYKLGHSWALKIKNNLGKGIDFTEQIKTGVSKYLSDGRLETAIVTMNTFGEGIDFSTSIQSGFEECLSRGMFDQAMRIKNEIKPEAVITENIKMCLEKCLTHGYVDQAMSIKNELGPEMDFTENIKAGYEKYLIKAVYTSKRWIPEIARIKEMFGQGIDFTENIKACIDKKLGDERSHGEEYNTIDYAADLKSELGAEIDIKPLIQKHAQRIKARFQQCLEKKKIESASLIKHELGTGVDFTDEIKVGLEKCLVAGHISTAIQIRDMFGTGIDFTENIRGALDLQLGSQEIERAIRTKEYLGAEIDLKSIINKHKTFILSVFVERFRIVFGTGSSESMYTAFGKTIDFTQTIKNFYEEAVRSSSGRSMESIQQKYVDIDFGPIIKKHSKKILSEFATLISSTFNFGYAAYIKKLCEDHIDFSDAIKAAGKLAIQAYDRNGDDHRRYTHALIAKFASDKIDFSDYIKQAYENHLQNHLIGRAMALRNGFESSVDFVSITKKYESAIVQEFELFLEKDKPGYSDNGAKEIRVMFGEEIDLAPTIQSTFEAALKGNGVVSAMFIKEQHGEYTDLRPIINAYHDTIIEQFERSFDGNGDILEAKKIKDSFGKEIDFTESIKQLFAKCLDAPILWPSAVCGIKDILGEGIDFNENIEKAFTKRLNKLAYADAAEIKKACKDTINFDSIVQAHITSGKCGTPKQVMNALLITEISEKLRTEYRDKHKEEIIKEYITSQPRQHELYLMLTSYLGENYLWKTIFSPITFWDNVHDHLLFAEKLHEQPHEKASHLCDLALKHILHQKKWTVDSDYEQLNQYMGYFDIDLYIEQHGHTPITSWTNFERQALLQKNNIHIPPNASPEFSHALQTLIAAPGVDVRFLRKMIHDYNTLNKSTEGKQEVKEGQSLLIPNITDELRIFSNFFNQELDFTSCGAYEEKNKIFFALYEQAEQVDILTNDGSIDHFSLLEILSDGQQYVIPVPVFLQILGYEIDGDSQGSDYSDSVRAILYNTKKRFSEDKTREAYFDDNQYDDNDYEDDDNDDQGNYRNGSYSSDFSHKLISIIEGKDDIDSRQIIPSHEVVLPFDPLCQVVATAIGFFPINQETVKYIELFKHDPHLQQMVRIYQEEQGKLAIALNQIKREQIKRFPEKRDYYIAEFQKDLAEQSLTIIENVTLKGFKISNIQQSLNCKDALVEPMRGFMTSQPEVCKNSLFALYSRKDKLATNSEMDVFADLAEIAGTLFGVENISNAEDKKRLFEQITPAQLIVAMEGHEALFASYLVYLGFNNRKRQSESKSIKSDLDRIINTPKYIKINDDMKLKKIVDERSTPSVNFLEGLLDITKEDKDKILELLRKYGYDTVGRSMKVAILPKSDPRGWVCGDYTNCCMPLTSEKNQEYLLREDMAYFTISIVDDGNETLVAQSVLVAADAKKKDQEKDKEESAFDALAVDNIEIANVAIPYRSILTQGYQELKKRFPEKMIVIGTSHNDDGGAITALCRSVPLEYTPLKGKMNYSDCFAHTNAYLFHDPENTYHSAYASYIIQSDNIDKSILKKFVEQETFGKIRGLLQHIGTGEDDGTEDGGLNFHDNYSTSWFKEGVYKGYVIAADYLKSDEENDALVIEALHFDPTTTQEEKQELLTEYFERVPWQEIGKITYNCPIDEQTVAIIEEICSKESTPKT